MCSRYWTLSNPSEEVPSRYRVRRVLDALAGLYPDARTALRFETPWQLLVATILSAQCTDVRVNIITERLFQRYPDARSLATLSEEEIAGLIRDCGLFRSKARYLSQTARIVVEEYGGDVPPSITHAEMTRLPGVGRKTANVVLSNAFGADALAVDTHVFRVAHRLGWSAARDADRTEADLTRLIPRREWSRVHHWLILHGRQVCHARRPACGRCAVARWCPGREDAVSSTARGQGGGLREGSGSGGRSSLSKSH